MHFLPEKLPDFSQAAILVVGDVMLDRYWFGEASRISPEAPVPVVKIQSADHRPGGAGNVALNLASLGTKAYLLGLVGEDEAAQMLAKQLSEKNVSHELCAVKDGSTIVKLRVISRQQQLIRLDFEEKNIPAKQHSLLDAFQKMLPKVNLVILSDYQKGTLADPQAFIRHAHDANIPVLVDPKGSDFSIYKHANIITPNFKEFEAIVGVCRTENEMVEKGLALLAQYQIDTLLLTRGENGMTLIKKDKSTAHFPAYAREVFDVTGAGDTAIATLGAAVAAGSDLSTATAIANLAASLVVGKLGAASVTAHELETTLTGKTTFSSGIVDENALLTAVREIRAQGKKIVFTNGCFDIFHAGHAACLQLAKQLGDCLIVAVNDDDSIKRQKGAHRPINPLHQRMAVLASLHAVDWVIPFADDTPERLLQSIQPDMLVKGGDYQPHEVVGGDIVQAYGGEVRVINHGIRTTSTHIIHRIQAQSEMRLHGEIETND